MLPIVNIGGASNSSPNSYFLRRILDVNQMDLQSNFDQMVTLCTLQPQRVYKTSYYRKKTKNHWARDDPAFVVIQVFLLFVTSICFSIAFQVTLLGFLMVLLHAIVINYILFGMLIATVNRAVCGKLTVHHTHSVKQSVEWLYAFDIHCNAFFPMFMVLYVLQFFLLPVVLGKSFTALLLANVLYATGFSWYCYITHLGYRALPFLTNSEVFLYPIVVILLCFVLSLIGYPFGIVINFSRFFATLYN